MNRGYVKKGGGAGDMSKTVYDPAGKQEQVLTISDVTNISNVVTTTETTLQDYIDNEWTSGDLADGDVVIVNVLATPEHYMLFQNNGANTTDYSQITSEQANEISYNNASSGLDATNLQNAIDELDVNRTYIAHGILTLPSYTDNGDGSITIDSDGEAIFYKNALSGKLYKQEMTIGGTFTITDGQTEVIFADKRTATPEYSKIALSSISLFETDGRTAPVYAVTRDGTDLCVQNYGEYAFALAEKNYYKDIVLNGTQRLDGLVLSETGTRTPNISAGSTYFGVTRQSHPAIDTVSNNAYVIYPTAGTYNKYATTEYDATYYTDGTNRVEMTNNRYSSRYIWRETNSDYIIIHYGNQYTSVSAAENEARPIIPSRYTRGAIYVGKIVVQKDDTSGIVLPRTFGESVVVSGAANHNDLANINLAGSGVTYGHINEVTFNNLPKLDSTNVFSDSNFFESVATKVLEIENPSEITLASFIDNDGAVNKSLELLKDLYDDDISLYHYTDGSQDQLLVGYDTESENSLYANGDIQHNKTDGTTFLKNVGFGVTTPDGVLHTYTDVIDDIPIFERFKSADNGLITATKWRATTDLAIDTDDPNGFGFMNEIQVKDTSGTYTIGYYGIMARDEVDSGYFRFIPVDSGTPSLSNSFVIDKTGKVGIREAEPTSLITASQGSSEEKIIDVQGGATTENIYLGVATDASTSGRFGVIGAGRGLYYITDTNNASSVSDHVWGTDGESDSFTELMRLDDEGSLWIFDDCSALSFTDRTPFPNTLDLAIKAVNSLKPLSKGKYDKNNKEHQLDHDKLHPYLQGKGETPNRDMSANISCNSMVIQHLLEENKIMKAKIELLEKYLDIKKAKKYNKRVEKIEKRLAKKRLKRIKKLRKNS